MITDADTVSGQYCPGDLASDVSRLQAENANLRRKLETQPAIEQAKGILMERYGVSADGAFELLRHWSQDSNTKLNHLAVVLTTGPKDGPAGVRPESRPS